MSGIMKIARDHSCLMSVDAVGGGRWLSPVKPGGSTQLTYDNATATDGVFRAVDSTISKWITTPCNLSAMDISTGITVAMSFIPSTDESTSAKKYHVFADNGFMANNQSPIGIAVDTRTTSSFIMTLLTSDKVSIGQTVSFANAPVILGAVNTVVYCYDAVTNKRRIVLNGFQQETDAPATHTMQLYNNSADTSYPWTKNLVIFTANTSWRNPDDKVMAVGIWNRSMGFSEMKAVKKLTGG